MNLKNLKTVAQETLRLLCPVYDTERKEPVAEPPTANLEKAEDDNIYRIKADARALTKRLRAADPKPTSSVVLVRQAGYAEELIMQELAQINQKMHDLDRKKKELSKTLQDAMRRDGVAELTGTQFRYTCATVDSSVNVIPWHRNHNLYAVAKSK